MAAKEVEGHLFERVSWSREAEDSLALALPTIDDRFVIARQVLDGASRLWRIDNGEAWMVTRVELPGPELVIVAYQGKNCREVCGIVHDQATKAGMRNLRFHTQYPWLIELFRDYDPMPMEYVVRVYCGEKRCSIYDGRREGAKQTSSSQEITICCAGSDSAPAEKEVDNGWR